MKMSGNTILITGGGSGIGLALAEEFAKLDNHVIVAGRSPEKLKAAAEKGLKPETVDMTDAASIQALAKRVTQAYPALNVVIHNAGISRIEDVLKGENSKTQEDIIATNILGPMRLTDALLPHLLKQASAAIMTVSSGLAFLPNAQTPTYSASKAAIHSYTQSLRYQLKDTNIEVIELIPPYVQTQLLNEEQATDPRAMPLMDYTLETIQILKDDPQVKEVLVNRVRELRFSEAGGSEGYDAFFKKYNDIIAASHVYDKQ